MALKIKQGWTYYEVIAPNFKTVNRARKCIPIAGFLHSHNVAPNRSLVALKNGTVAEVEDNGIG